MEFALSLHSYQKREKKKRRNEAQRDGKAESESTEVSAVSARGESENWLKGRVEVEGKEKKDACRTFPVCWRELLDV